MLVVYSGTGTDGEAFDVAWRTLRLDSDALTEIGADSVRPSSATTCTGWHPPSVSKHTAQVDALPGLLRHGV